MSRPKTVKPKDSNDKTKFKKQKYQEVMPCIMRSLDSLLEKFSFPSNARLIVSQKLMQFQSSCEDDINERGRSSAKIIISSDIPLETFPEIDILQETTNTTSIHEEHHMLTSDLSKMFPSDA